MKFSRVWKTTVLILLSAACGSVAQELMSEEMVNEDMEISGFRVPDYDAQGVMTSQLFGDRAVAQGGGKVKINGVRMEFYKEGKTFMEVTSPYCTFDQKTREATSDAPIAADMEGVRVRGRGFVLKSGDRKVRILNDSKVIIDDVAGQTENTLKGGERDPAAVTVITSKELFLDYSGRNVLFEQFVHVEDPQLSMDCNTMNVRFDENNEIDWIEALDEVKLFSEGREALAGRAVYDVRANEFLLEDNPRVLQGRNMLLGERIRFWRETGRMVCEPSARLIMYTDEEGEAGIF